MTAAKGQLNGTDTPRMTVQTPALLDARRLADKAMAGNGVKPLLQKVKMTADATGLTRLRQAIKRSPSRSEPAACGRGHFFAGGSSSASGF